jgi:hypothetical protein
MSVILTNVQAFVEQVGRRRMHKRSAVELDTMDCVFLGPQALVSAAIPFDGAPHPIYPQMQSVGWEVTDREATLCEVRVSYVGKFQPGVPLVSTSWAEGSISWTTFVSDLSKILVPGHAGYAISQQTGLNGSISQGVWVPATPPVMSKAFLSVSYVSRFRIETVTTTTLVRDGGSAGGAGGGAVSSNVVFPTGCSLSDNKFGLATATLAFEAISNTKTADLGNGWTEVSVVGTMQPVINSTVDMTPPSST